MATDGDRPEKNISEPETPTAADSHGAFVMAGPAHNYEYEPDTFAVRTILAVPVAVVITGLLAFGITWWLFSSVFDPKIKEAPQNETAARRNDEDLNQRLERISSSDPKAEVQQPRLEGLNRTEVYGRNGDPKTAEGRDRITSEMVSTQPTKEGNSPRYHAEDLRPDRVKELQASGTDPKTGLTKIPVEDAIKLLVQSGMLPAQEGARRLDVDPDWDRPKESNGGTGKMPEPPKAKKAADKKDAEEKKGDEKKGDEKKGDEKKGDEKKGDDKK